MYVHKAEKLLKQLFLVGVLKVKDENSRTRSRIWIMIHTSEAWILGSRSYHICLMVEGFRSASGSGPLAICFSWLNSFRVLCNKIVCSMTVFFNSRNVRYPFSCRYYRSKANIYLVTAQLNKITSLYLFFIEPPPLSTVPIKGAQA